VDDEPLRLDQFLKLLSLVQSGGEAKQLIQGGQVRLNGHIEMRRSKKLVIGDVVTFRDQDYVVEASRLRHGQTGV